MPRAHVDSNQPHYDRAVHALRSDVVRKVGFDVRTVKECKILSGEIERFDRRFPLAVSTLRRFFQLIASDSKFSISTLNTLARFAGKRAFSHYLDLTKAESLSSNDHIGTESFQQQDGILPTRLEQLIDILELAPYAAPGSDFLHQLAKAAASTYASDHKMTPELIERLTTSKRLRAVVIEKYPPLDWMAPGQNGARLMEAYLQMATQQEERDYAVGLLAQGALFAGELGICEDWLKHFGGIHRGTPAPPIHQSRACAVQWLLSSWNANVAMKAKAQRDLAENIAPADPTTFPAFATAAVRVILISGHKDLIQATLKVFEAAMRQAELQLEASHAVHALNLELAWLAYLSGETDLAIDSVNKINEQSFAAHDHSTCLVLWHTLHGHLTSDAKERSQHFQAAESWARRMNCLSLHSHLLLAAPVLSSAETLRSFPR